MQCSASLIVAKGKNFHKKIFPALLMLKEGYEYSGLTTKILFKEFARKNAIFLFELNVALFKI